MLVINSTQEEFSLRYDLSEYQIEYFENKRFYGKFLRISRNGRFLDLCFIKGVNIPIGSAIERIDHHFNKAIPAIGAGTVFIRNGCKYRYNDIRHDGASMCTNLDDGVETIIALPLEHLIKEL